MRIRVKWSSGELECTLRDTDTARSVFAALPVTARASTWGEEVYFDLPVHAELEPDCQQVVDRGTVCYWVQGGAMALPYGPTPVSQGKECRLVTAVNLLGQFDGDSRKLATVRAGEEITVERVE
ncbi:MAG: hypothetical protein KJ052_06165 [Candidatus Hydrogenedentes bacterium]|nr:hypothetical protein [Candidatus Hydrogenedentota bacterium]